MNKFEKFMVVPYQKKEEEIPKENKILQILNNNKLNKSDKSKLIDQLLIADSKEINQDPIQELIKQPKINAPKFDFQKQAKTKKKQEFYKDIDLINEMLNKNKGLTNNGELFLNPATSTRSQKNKNKDKLNISLNQIKQIEKALIKKNKKLIKAPTKIRTQKRTKTPPPPPIDLDQTFRKDLNQTQFQSFSESPNKSTSLDWKTYQ